MNAYFEDILLNAEIFKNTHINEEHLMSTLERNLDIKFENMMNKFILDGEIVKEFLINDLIKSILQIEEHVFTNPRFVSGLEVPLTDGEFNELKEMISQLIDYHFNEDRTIDYYVNERKTIEEDFIKVFNNSANLTYHNDKIIGKVYFLIINKLKQLITQADNHGRNYDLMKFIDVAIAKKHFEKINVLVADFEDNIICNYINDDDTIKNLLDERFENLSLIDLNVALNSLDNSNSEKVKNNLLIIKDFINIISIYQSICTNKFSVKIFNFIYSLAIIEFKNKVSKTGKYFDYSRVCVNDMLYKTEIMSTTILEHLSVYTSIFCDHIMLYETICVGLQILYNNFTENPSSDVISTCVNEIYELLEKDLIDNDFYKFSTYYSSTYNLFTSYCEMIKMNRKLKLKDFIKIYEPKPVMEYQDLTTNLLLDSHDFKFMSKEPEYIIRFEPVIEILLTLYVEDHSINENIYKSITREAVRKMMQLYNIKIDPKLQTKYELILLNFK